jgi:parallel beta-helix repeat protein
MNLNEADMKYIGVFALLLSALTGTAFAGNTYYVAKTGRDSNTCAQAQSAGTAKLTLAGGIGCMTGGDTLIVKAGTYAELISASQIPSGSSWNAATTIQAAAGETVWLQPPMHHTGVWFGSVSYIVIDGINLDATNNVTGIRFQATVDGVSTHHIRLQHMEIKNASWYQTGSTIGSGIGMFWRYTGNQFIEFKKLNVHHNGRTGSNQGHGIYAVGEDILTEDCVVWSNAGHGIHYFEDARHTHRGIIRRNTVYGNGSRGILLGSGDDSVAYNNLVYNNGFIYGAAGMACGFGGAVNCRLYNNTIHGNYQGVEVRADASGTIVRNNIIYQLSGMQVTNAGANTTFSNNLCGASGTGCALTGNPLFVNPTTQDYRLQSSSSAIDAGATIAAVTTDRDGVARPQQGYYDIGAHEYVDGSAPKPPMNLRIAKVE